MLAWSVDNPATIINGFPNDWARILAGPPKLQKD
jgi:hypothetical protein